MSGGTGLRGRLRRLERLTSGDTVSLEQTDGTTRTFPTTDFNLALFVAASDAASGITPEGPVPDALRGATAGDWERLERLAASGGAGDFLRRAVSCGGLLKVADDVGDLSEQA